MARRNGQSTDEEKPIKLKDLKSNGNDSLKKNSYISQSDVPRHPLAQALRVPRAIADHYGFKPTKPLDVAVALGVQPNSSQFRTICGAAIAYGFTKGGPNALEISIEPLGMRVVRPTVEDDDMVAKREALQKPRVIGEFLKRYNQATIPREDIGANVLIDLGVPAERAREVFELIIDGAESVGMIKTIKGKRYLDLMAVPISDNGEMEQEDPSTNQYDDKENFVNTNEIADRQALQPNHQDQPLPSLADRRVFLSHGKNKVFIEPIKKLLGFGQLEAVVSVERTSISQPVPDKVISDMRGCGAAIIHVEPEEFLKDETGSDRAIINPNVLIEIGAAIALYGRRFILLVKDGVKLPSNLQGLFEVRYSGNALDAEATIRLLEAINDIKNHPMPNRYVSDKSVP
ncbi:MAG: TIR domain-containing protein [Armatimonadota bacterium]